MKQYSQQVIPQNKMILNLVLEILNNYNYQVAQLLAPVETNAVNPSKAWSGQSNYLTQFVKKQIQLYQVKIYRLFIPDTATLPKRKKRSSLFCNVFSSIITPKTYAADTPAPLTTPPRH